MRRKSLPLFVVLAISAVTSAQISPMPYSVKGDRLGESLSEWTNNHPFSHRCDETLLDLPGDEHSWMAYCLTREPHHGDSFTYANRLLLTEEAWFHSGKLYRIAVNFLNDEPLPDLLRGLKQKFGKPYSHKTSHLQNGFGSQFEEKRVTWTNKLSMLELIYSTVPGNHARLIFTLDVPRTEAQWKREQITRACADM